MGRIQEAEVGIRDMKDSFENNVFSSEAWSAATLVSPQKIRNKLEACNLIGRHIEDITFVGLCYNFTKGDLESQAWNILRGCKDEHERKYRSRYKNLDPDLPILTYAQIDEPMLVRFADGDTLEILVYYEREYRMSMNRIPWDIKYGCNQPNVDAKKLFNNCVGRTVTGVEVHTCIREEKDWSFGTSCINEEGNKYVSDIVIRLDDGTGIKMEGWYDYCDVTHVDSEGRILTRPYKELRSAITRIY